MASTAVVDDVTPPSCERRANGPKDRCDVGQCGAQAFIIAEKLLVEDDEPQVTELFFCGHHGRKCTPGLVAAGFDIIDNTGDINKNPSISASVE